MKMARHRRAIVGGRPAAIRGSDQAEGLDRVALLDQFADRLQRSTEAMLTRCGERIGQLDKLLESYSFHSVLNRGFALVRDQDGQPILSAAGVRAGDTIGIEFGDGEVRARVSDGTTGARPATAGPRKREPGNGGSQGSLL